MNNKQKYFLIIGSFGQWLSVFVMICGIYLLFSCGLDIGTIMFSLGCLLETLATKIKYYGGEYIKQNTDVLKIIYEKGRFKRLNVKKVVVDDPEQYSFF
jgi:hypothetical protein